VTRRRRLPDDAAVAIEPDTRARYQDGLQAYASQFHIPPGATSGTGRR
jgi:hypothetical protein